MKTLSFNLKKTVVASATAVTLLAAPLFIHSTSIDALSAGGFFPLANAAQGEGKGHQGGSGGGGGQGQGSQMKGGESGQGGRSGMDKVLEADEDSDRPEWAQGNRDANPHNQGGGQPPGAGDKKGDEYGDLIVLLRDPVTGLPLVDEETGEFFICLDAGCTETTLTQDGEIPEGVVPLEVDFGRASIARSPDKVIDKALDDALAKLTADGVVLSQDEAGRITYTVDGITSTIDSPLENLALYIDLMEGLASDSTSAAEAALGDLANLDTAAALFAGVADKTGDISLDYVFYHNLITDVVAQPDTYYDFSGFTYDRDFPTDYTYFVVLAEGEDPVTRTLDINAYLEAVNGSLPADGDFAALFASASDDALEVIELIHTQIHYEVLPGTVE